MRKKIIIANWKMNLKLSEIIDFSNKLSTKLSNKEVDVVICPPFPYLGTLSQALKSTRISIGAQNMFYKEEGAYTGEVSPKMLLDFLVRYVILGHSERRQVFKETNEDVNLKIKLALKFNLIPVLCVGENLETREKGGQEDYVRNQLLNSTKDLGQNDLEKLIIAYEPIWAIGTGRICSGEDANKIIKMIRKTIKLKSNDSIAQKVRILYGGSIKASNFQEHIKYPDIDGGLVGGTRLIFEEFSKVIDLASASNVHALHQSHPV